MAKFSIVLPTYNRRDTIGRAVASVRAQSFDDWELLVVDDGSTDGTADLLAGVDPRVRVIVQSNQGVAGARNTGLAGAKGDLIAFLDSDDEWPPYHLELASAFFAAHPGEDVVTTEFWEDFGDHRTVKHFRVETAEWYPAMARAIGSTAFDRAPPEGDPYLWFYSTRSEPGAWARRILDRSGHRPVFHYRGDIFRHWRWGWLMAMQPTVITRRAMEAVGPNDATYTVASDFGYLASLCRRFPVNLLSLPGCFKHEYGEGKRRLAEGHLVTGRTAVRFHEDVLRFHEELFCRERPDDPELARLRGFRHSLVGEAALRQGERKVALSHLEAAVATYPTDDVQRMLRMAHLVRQDKLLALTFRGWKAAAGLSARVRSRVPNLAAGERARS